jgi:hypothetical protein
VPIYQYYVIIKENVKGIYMSDWQVYLMMFVIVSLMLLGKKMMFFDDSEKDKKNLKEPAEQKDKN